MRDGFHYKFWVYILCSRSGTLYVGITGFFAQRIHQHKDDSIEGFTKKYQVDRLVYYESHQDVNVAIAREKQVKRWRREKEDCVDRKSKRSMAGPGGELGTRNAFPGTEHGSNT